MCQWNSDGQTLSLLHLPLPQRCFLLRWSEVKWSIHHVQLVSFAGSSYPLNALNVGPSFLPTLNPGDLTCSHHFEALPPQRTSRCKSSDLSSPLFPVFQCLLDFSQGSWTSHLKISPHELSPNLLFLSSLLHLSKWNVHWPRCSSRKSESDLLLLLLPHTYTVHCQVLMILPPKYISGLWA